MKIDKYDLAAAEQRLARLLGWNDVSPHGMARKPGGPWDHYPRWCSDDAAAFQLMVEHGIWSSLRHGISTDGIVSNVGLSRTVIKVPWADHPDKLTAMRYAIVLAVTAKLEHHQAKQAKEGKPT